MRFFSCLVLAGLVACGSSDGGSGTSSGPPDPALFKTFVLRGALDGLEGYSLLRLAFDFSIPDREVSFDETLVVRVPAPVRTSGGVTCDPNQDPGYTEALGSQPPVVDRGYVGSVRLDFKQIILSDDTLPSLCFASYTQSGGWTWHWTKSPLVVDDPSALQSFAPSPGHFNVAVNQPNVEAVALLLDRPELLTPTKITYTAVPSM